jgi:hypothetical protein
LFSSLTSLATASAVIAVAVRGDRGVVPRALARDADATITFTLSQIIDESGQSLHFALHIHNTDHNFFFFFFFQRLFFFFFFFFFALCVRVCVQLKRLRENRNTKANTTPNMKNLLRGLELNALATLAVSASLSELGSPELTAVFKFATNSHVSLAQFSPIVFDSVVILASFCG